MATKSPSKVSKVPSRVVVGAGTKKRSTGSSAASTKTQSNSFARRLSRLSTKSALAIATVVAFAGVGTYLLVSSHADSLGSVLGTNQTLTAGNELDSPDGGMRLVLQTDGNLVYYNHSNYPVWSTATNGKGGAILIMQSDGNLVLYTAGYAKALWYTSTSGSGSYLAAQNDGNLVVYKSGGGSAWQAGTSNKLGSQIRNNQRLEKGSDLTSPDGGMRLEMQSDGNLVLYNHNNYPVWQTATGGGKGSYAIMQNDGNMVVYNSNGSAVWSSQTNNSGAAVATVQNDGNFVLYDSANKAIWQSHTAGKATTAPTPTNGIVAYAGNNDGCGGNATHYNGSTHVGQTNYGTGSTCKCSANKALVAYGPAYQTTTLNPKCPKPSTTPPAPVSTPVPVSTATRSCITLDSRGYGIYNQPYYQDWRAGDGSQYGVCYKANQAKIANCVAPAYQQAVLQGNGVYEYEWNCQIPASSPYN